MNPNLIKEHYPWSLNQHWLFLNLSCSQKNPFIISENLYKNDLPHRVYSNMITVIEYVEMLEMEQF